MNNEQFLEQIKEYMQANGLTYLRKSNLASIAVAYGYELEDVNNFFATNYNVVTSFMERIGTTQYTRFILGNHLSTEQITNATGLVRCYDCGCFHTPNNFVTSDGLHFCNEECARYSCYYICSKCGKLEKAVFTSGDKHICKDCIEQYASENNLKKCSSCNNYYEATQVYKIGDKTYCKRCVEYTNIVRGYNGYGRTNWKKYKNNREKDIFLGYENEFECKGDTPRNVLAYAVNELLKQNNIEGFFVYEQDGSLNNGLEFPTKPFTLAWMLANEEKLQQVYDYLLANKCTGEKNDTAGLHVHISRTAFKNDYTLAKVAFLIHKLQYDFIKFSNRSIANLRYCQFDSPNVNGEYTLADFKRRYNSNTEITGGHGVAVNREHENTIEIRIFKGTLDLKRIIANCELVSNLVEYCDKHTDTQVKNVTFKELCLWKKTKHLKPLYYKLFEPTTKIKGAV